ncbi:aspartate/tyrosine/aromatic aminotransferase [Bernardetia litoralis DSM 6794]|uniref:Aminotransferase n=1 Tax=Bernardetia litoralis (strain ATCC 23117 / DSM 6794 / NBRC 15988 / NCIMB 1366 / Fx l1 / Sio-4) TaxID=880071 RepID=I4AH55_BERLS|nr:pyridoxal phosphate-dependent aminotransferase [Bernardetia litoralis]AFM03290.1 aspartate/tyrosine/aromatic aminotransferase [Bernardetia litoralis DSM 6794]
MTLIETNIDILSRRVSEMEESQTLAMAGKSRQLKEQGIDIINMNLGEPDFKTPLFIQEAAKKAIDDGHFGYTPVSGIAPLRQAIADKLKRENQLDYATNQIVVSTGAKQSIANVMLALLNKGDEVIIITPYWVSYVGIVQLAEGTPVFVEGKLENDYKATAEDVKAAITSKTKAVIFSSPCNPTGSVFSEKELREIAEVIAPHPQITVVADEIYEYINFGEPHFSIGRVESLKDRVVTINGLSKGFAMTGWRLGYAACPLTIAKACDKIQGQVTSGTNSITQHAAVAALNGSRAEVEEMKNAYEKRGKLMKSLLDNVKGFKCNTPQGAFYVFPDVSDFYGKKYEGKTIANSEDFSMFLLETANVAVVMGDAFGAPNCIRLSFATSEELIKKAIERIEDAVSKLS